MPPKFELNKDKQHLLHSHIPQILFDAYKYEPNMDMMGGVTDCVI
jgi:hypothetical protein